MRSSTAFIRGRRRPPCASAAARGATDTGRRCSSCRLPSAVCVPLRWRRRLCCGVPITTIPHGVVRRAMCVTAGCGARGCRWVSPLIAAGSAGRRCCGHPPRSRRAYGARVRWPGTTLRRPVPTTTITCPVTSRARRSRPSTPCGAPATNAIRRSTGQSSTAVIGCSPTARRSMPSKIGWNVRCGCRRRFVSRPRSIRS